MHLLILQIGTIDNLHLDEIEWTLDQLARFLHQVPALSNLHQLTFGRRCRLKARMKEETSSIRVNAGEIVMRLSIFCDLLRSMLDVISCRTLIIEKDARLLKRHLNNTHDNNHDMVSFQEQMKMLFLTSFTLI